MTRRPTTLAMVVALTGQVFAAPVEDGEDGEHGVAVIVGNRNYADERVPEVTYAHRDAEAFKRYVVDVLGFDDDNVIDLRDATQAEMETAFGNERDHEGKLWSYLNPEGGSDVVVYYSGHGVPGLEDRKGYLLPVDANPDTARLNGYPIELLYENLGKLAEAESLRVFLDACFSGGSQGGMLIDASSPVYVSAEVPVLSEKSGTVLTAASGDQIASWDKEAGHGLFTHHLLDALYGQGDADGDGRVTATETKRYLDRHMTRAARRTYLRNQNAGLHGDGSVVLASASRGGFPGRPELRGEPAPTWPFTVETEPAGARVRILDIEERYRPGMVLPSGEYRVEARLDGHETTVEVVRHGAEGATAHRVVLARTAPQAGERFRDCPTCPEMAVVPAGRFRMGCLSNDGDCFADEKPVRDVRIGNAFGLSVHEVTRGGFRRFVAATGHAMGGSCWTYEDGEWDYRDGRGWLGPGFAQSDGHPAVCVSWEDARAYAAWLSRETGQAYRLPSESEWEYAARAGSSAKYHFGSSESDLCRYANHADASTSCSDGVGWTTAPAGTFEANGFGLHDMHGNVWEWVADC